MGRLRFWIEIHSVPEGTRSRAIDSDDLMGVINGSLSSYTMIMNPGDPLSSTVTIRRVETSDE